MSFSSILVLLLLLFSHRVPLALAGNACSSGYCREVDLAVPLDYNGLTAYLNYGDNTGNENHATHVWTELVTKISSDADALTGSVDRYDIWPTPPDLVNVQQPAGQLGAPQYFIKFELKPNGAGCPQQPLNAALLHAFSAVFSELARTGQGVPVREFTGTVDKGKTTFFVFKMFGMGPMSNIRRKKRDILPSDLDFIHAGAAVIEDQINPFDLVFFISSVVAPFYYALTRPGPRIFLVPISGSTWYSSPRTANRNAPKLKVSAQYAAFKENVLGPAFAMRVNSPSARVVLIDYSVSGTSLQSFVFMLWDSGLWGSTDPATGKMKAKSVTYINVQASDVVPSGVKSVRAIKLGDPVNVGSDANLEVLRSSEFGKLCPSLYWQYWDIPLADVDYADQPSAQQTIDTIKSTRYGD